MTDDTEQNDGWLASSRRDVMKALGAGTTLGVLGGTASAQGQVSTAEQTASVQAGVGSLQDESVHVVQTLIREATNDNRPVDFFYQPTGLHVQPGDVVKWVFVTPDHNVTSYHPAFGMQRRMPTDAPPIAAPILGWDPRSLPEGITMPPGEGGDGENGDGEGETTATPTATATPTDTPTGTATETPTETGDAEDGGPVPSTWLYAFETPGVYDLECSPHETYGMAMRIVVGDETETEFETENADELPPPRAGPVGLARGVLTDPVLAPETIVESGSVEWQELEGYAGDGADNDGDGDGDGGNGDGNGDGNGGGA